MNENKCPFKVFLSLRFSLKETVPTVLKPLYRLLHSLPVLRQRKAHYSKFLQQSTKYYKEKEIYEELLGVRKWKSIKHGGEERGSI